jgi:putative transposase
MRRRSLRVTPRDEDLLPHVQALKADHPFGGYRRIGASSRFGERVLAKKQRILRLLREHHRLVTHRSRPKAHRTPPRSKSRPTKPDAWWGIDVTKVLVEGFGWVYIVLVWDWYTKKIVGYYTGRPCPAKHWLTAQGMAVNRQSPDGARGQSGSLRSDNGRHPTPMACMQAWARLGSHHAFTGSNTQGDADTERAMRPRTEECLWLREWTCPVELSRTLGSWIAYSNAHHRHAALGYKPPRQLERDDHLSRGTQFVAA